MKGRWHGAAVALAVALVAASVAGGAVPARVVSAASAGSAQQNGTGTGESGAQVGTEIPAEDGGVETGSGATVIDSCTTISNPGHYVLGADIRDARASEDAVGNTSACIVIRSDDVVLEGAGHVVDGRGFPAPNATAEGADADGRDPADGDAGGTEVTGRDAFGAGPVLDGSVAENGSVGVADGSAAVDGTFPAGVAAVAPGKSTLDNVTVTNLTATDWFVGVLGARLSGATVWGVNASGNADVGLELLDLTEATVANNTANDNGFAGIYVSGDGDNLLANNDARNNTVAGIDLHASDDALLWRNVVAGNGAAGIALVGSDRVRIVDSALADTRGDDSSTGFSGGLVLVDASDVVASNTTATGNRRWTVYATAGSGVSMENLTAGGSTVSLMGRDFALGRAAAVGGENVSSVGSGLVVTNTSDGDSSLTLSVDWAADASATETQTPTASPEAASPSGSETPGSAGASPTTSASSTRTASSTPTATPSSTPTASPTTSSVPTASPTDSPTPASTPASGATGTAAETRTATETGTDPERTPELLLTPPPREPPQENETTPADNGTATAG